MPSKLPQKAFAQLLTQAMKELRVQGVELSQSTHIDPRTISRYRDPAYAGGPPIEKRRRALERGLGVPEGYLEGGMVVDFKDLLNKRLNAGRVAIRSSPEQSLVQEFHRAKEAIRRRGVGDKLDQVMGVQISQLERYHERDKPLALFDALDMLQFLWEAGVEAVAAAAQAAERKPGHSSASGER